MKTEIDWQQLLDQVASGALSLGKSILIALVIYFVGRYLIKLVNRLIQKVEFRLKLKRILLEDVGLFCLLRKMVLKSYPKN